MVTLDGFLNFVSLGVWGDLAGSPLGNSLADVTGTWDSGDDTSVFSPASTGAPAWLYFVLVIVALILIAYILREVLG